LEALGPRFSTVHIPRVYFQSLYLPLGALVYCASSPFFRGLLNFYKRAFSLGKGCTYFGSEKPWFLHVVRGLIPLLSIPYRFYDSRGALISILGPPHYLPRECLEPCFRLCWLSVPELVAIELDAAIERSGRRCVFHRMNVCST